MTDAARLDTADTWPPPKADILAVKAHHRKDDDGYCTDCRPYENEHIRVKWPCQKARLVRHAEALAAEVERLKKVEAAALAWCLEMSRYACDIPCRHSDCRLIRALGGTEEHLPAALSGERGAGVAG